MNDGMRVLVTGANGFIGSVVCRYVREHGYNVRGAVRSTRNVEWMMDTVVTGDIGGRVDWRPVLRETDVVIHLAGRAHVLRETAPQPLDEFRRVNVEATKRLAKAAAEAGVRRFIFISSIGVNGETSGLDSFTEEDQPRPSTPYAVSKYEAELSLWPLQESTGMEIVCVRPPLVYGARAPGNVALLKNLIERGIPLPLRSTYNSRTLVGVDNLASLLVCCIEHPKAAGELFLVGDAENVSTQQLAAAIGKAINRPTRLVPFPPKLAFRLASLVGKVQLANSLYGNLIVNSTKARTLLGWSPPYTLAEGLALAFQA